MECIICSSRAVRDDRFVYDDRFGYPGIFKIVSCSSCRHRSLQNEFRNDELLHLYTEYYPRSVLNVDDYKPHEEVSGFKAWLDGAYRSAFRWVPSNVKVLDIGCGFGETLGYHKARGCDVYGVEADENIRRVADRYGFKVHVGLFDPDMYEPGFFDYVTMDQVIEHMADPLKIMNGIRKVLKPGGKAILSTPNSNGWGEKIFGRRWINWHAPYHLQHFSEKSIAIAAEKSGLVLEKVKTITSSEWLHYQWNHLAAYPKEGMPSGFWSANGKLNVYQKTVVQLLHFIHKTKVNNCITRLFDSLGIGDNYLIFLRKPV